MNLRCTECLSTTPVAILHLGASVTCARCGGSLPLSSGGIDADATQQERHRLVLDLATSSELDEATACSVVLGIMSLEQAHSVGHLDARSASESAESLGEELHSVVFDAGASSVLGQLDSRLEFTQSSPTAKTSGETRSGSTDTPASASGLDLDPAFAEAVRDGRMTMHDALLRGDRRVLTRRLTERQGLAPGLAEAVVDNRMTLSAAFAEQEKRLVEARLPRRRLRAPRAQSLLIVGMAVPLVLLMLSAIWNRNFAPAPRFDPEDASLEREHSSAIGSLSAHPAKPPSAVKIETDADGRPTRIEGPDAASVLAAFCGHDSWLQPIRLSPTASPRPEMQLGILLDSSDGQSHKSIYIRRDWNTRRWAAGDGVRPIAMRPAPKPVAAVAQL